MSSTPKLARGRIVAPHAVIGLVAIVAGGVVAAAIAHAPTETGTWAVAYLVLVVGVAQLALGVGQALLTGQTPSGIVVLGELLAWNIGSAGVIAGAALGVLAITAAGGALLVVALGMFLALTRGAPASWLVVIYRLVIAVVLVSVPVGIILQAVRGQ